MADEKLPSHLESFFAICDTCHGRLATACATCSQLRLAIHRFAREREAAALERAAVLHEQIDVGKDRDGTGMAAIIKYRDAIRALIHKEPANG